MTAFNIHNPNVVNPSWGSFSSSALIYNFPSGFYNHQNQGFTYYDFDRPYDNDSDDSHHHYYVTPARDVDMDDVIKGSNKKEDYLYGGQGDDELHGRGKADILVGGNGNDVIYADDGADTIYGDWSDMPEVQDNNGNQIDPHTNNSVGPDLWFPNPAQPYDSNGNFVTYPTGDRRNQDLTVTGDDVIYGKDGSDIIVAGPGNDMISAGPRGSSSNPYTDDVTGGPGSDSFILSYEDENSEAPESFWSEYAFEQIGKQGGNTTKSVVSALVKTGAEDAFGKVGASMLGGTLGGLAGGAATAGIDYLLGMGKAPKPKTNEDVLVIRDFNPSEDSLFLTFDLNDAKTLSTVVTYYVSSPVQSLDVSGWGIAFNSGVDGTTYAEVFLDDAWLQALGIPNSSSVLAETAIENMLSTGINITPTGYEDPETVDPFGDADPDPVPLESQDGSYTHVWGAYMPVSIVQPASSNGIRIGGTVMSDLLSVNDEAFPPDYYADFRATGLVATDRSLIRGFDGDDILFGGAGSDVIHGDGGNDLIWSFDSGTDASGSQPETLSGGEGHDRLIALAGEQLLDGGPGSDVMDGGPDYDTATYADAAQAVQIDLTTGIGYDSAPAYDQIGEFGSVTLQQDDRVTVNLSQTYISPVVLIGPYPNGAAYVSTPRLDEITSDSFTVFAEPEWQSGLANATVDYLVVEAGAWELDDGTILAAEQISTAAAAPNYFDSSYEFATNYYTTYFNSTPTVVSQVQSNNDDGANNPEATRQQSQDSTTFEIGLQGLEGDPDTGSVTETIGYVAIEQGLSTANGVAFEAFTTPALFDSNQNLLSYQNSYTQAPHFFGNIASMNDTDNAFLQRGSHGVGGSNLYVQEDTSADAETTHGAEQVSYLTLASDGNTTLTGRVAPDKLFGIENLIGSAYDDMLTGNALDNTFTGGLGADQIDGMGGNDTATYQDSTVAVTVDLTASANNSGGTAAGDVLTNIENLVGSDYADTLVGDDQNNILAGGLGANVLTGGNGNDTFVASTDGDTITDFMSGDLIDLSENWYNYNDFSQVNISGPVTSGSKYVYSFTLQSSSGNAVVTVETDAPYTWSGSDFVFQDLNYTFVGTDSDDFIVGGPGHNKLYAHGGNDTVFGDLGDDHIDGGLGEDTLLGGSGADTLVGDDGEDTFTGRVDDLYSDTIVDFTYDDKVLLAGDTIGRDQISVTSGSAIIGVDDDGDGAEDGSFTLLGDFSSGDFMAVVDGTDTVITFHDFLPGLSDGAAVDPALVNGIINELFLTGTGTKEFTIDLRSMGYAEYDNALGVYEVDGAGNIVDTRLLFNSTNANKTATTTVSNVEDGNTLGFFIVQNAANWANSLDASDTFSFVTSGGAPATISDGLDVLLAVNGAASDQTVFHGFESGLNADGIVHALSGVEPGGQQIVVGFEDLFGGGDRDYEDVVLAITPFDTSGAII